ncbi:hypothetical protein ASD65_05615 [Microbacterium sp. Root61]|uniref:hypothetical protein n=1 Tax=Microbacterium sp. Root61 TaxID=1736570 RepID=UPI0006F91315|nr:hypothetical protein [Microbacterium sp. Root61]KRA23955.1 hypothetical protein ASD65_05615 [Microbacterium sp. Root61]
MTRAQGPGTELSFRIFGTPGAARTVFVLRTGPAAILDPDPPTTIRRDVRIIAVQVTPAELSDPGAYRGETPAELAVASLDELVVEEVPDGATVGVVGVGAAAAFSALFVCELGERADRFALVGVPAPSSALDRDEGAGILARVRAKTLLLNGQGDGDAGAASASWHRDHLSDARVEMVPRAGAGAKALGLTEVWPRVLSHVAPGTIRGT